MNGGSLVALMMSLARPIAVTPPPTPPTPTGGPGFVDRGNDVGSYSREK